MVFTSYCPIYTLASAAAPSSSSGYHRFHIGKTREFAVLWLLYIRQHLGPDEHITIVDQGGDIPISYLLDHVTEPYDIGPPNDAIAPFDPDSPNRLHIRQFDSREGIREGVKRLYHYMYKTCWRYYLDMFFIENDCLITRDWLHEIRSKSVDFATNTMDLKHRCCDTYINYISAARFHDRDAMMKLDEWLDWVKATWGTYEHANDWDALYDVSSTILNERGVYLRWCYGNILTFNNVDVMHSVPNGDADRLAFLKAHPLDHPFYRSFMEEATAVVTARASTQPA